MPTIHPAGDAAFLVDIGNRIDPIVNRQVHAIAARIAEALGEYPRIEVIPAYTTILVSFDPTAVPAEQQASLVQAVEAAIRQAAQSNVSSRSHEGRRFALPVCYGGEYGPDLEDVA